MADKRLLKYVKSDGVRDLPSIKARGRFAQALIIEEDAGHTTDEALELLDEAIKETEGES